MSLRLDWCDHKAARYAVEKWHYSKTMPAGKIVRIGVWEDSRFIGCVLYGSGAGPQIADPFGLKRTEVCELVRVALARHSAEVTRVVAISLRMLKSANPGLRAVVSYADPEQGHTGVIYRAGNWRYLGITKACTHFKTVAGTHIHSKTLCTGRRGYATKMLKCGAIIQVRLWKYKYAMPLDKEMATKLDGMSKRFSASEVKPATRQPHQAGKGGATPTLTL